ncbi:restriction endonuclease subunit S [Streptococcus ruminantium]|uniref:restriction endonuclease subunit S n=1 Tax=Streptococcus ruminantium TaxID=1917441 RepID=UPI0012DE57CD|nr:restriction endonuclease subunit S [Streptococcus ruminantium]
MTYIDEMMKELCPDGVEWKELGDPEVAKLSRGKVMSKQFLEENKGEFPVYSSQTANNGEIGRISSFDFDGEYITWTTDGANAGTVFYRQGQFSITNVCGIVDIKCKELLPKFVYYFLTITTKKHVSSGMGNPKLMSNVMAKIKIPLPPLEIQEEIVKILDKFTDYVTELTAELTLRQQQYSFYRDKLLSFDEDSSGGANNKVYTVQWKTLGEVCRKVSSGGTPKSDNEGYYGGDIPWLRTQDIDFKDIVSTSATITQAGLENSSAKWVPINSVVIAMYGATAGKSAVTKIPLTTNQACCNLEVDEELANYRYVYHWVYKNYELLKAKGQGSQSNISGKIIKDFSIPLPSLDIQSRIVEVLDNFDTVCNDLNIGLPKEIELRQKQYEFFRDQLLTFTAEGVYTDSTVQYSTVQTRPN